MRQKNKIGDCVVCPDCGKKWTRSAASLSGGRRCAECRRIASKKRREYLGLSFANRFGQQVSNDAIFRARNKPKGCSNVRWRIELRRRQDRRLYDLAAIDPR